MARSITQMGFVVVFLLVGCSRQIGNIAPPSISVSNGEFELLLPDKMKKALHGLNPRFKAWKTSDYTRNVISETLGSKDPRRAPFALVIDLNHDNYPEVIIDGHDDKSALLICIYTVKGKPRAVVVRSGDLFDPRTVENFYNGKKDPGIPYFLWPPNPNVKSPHMSTFSIAYPQPLDEDGKEVGDASVVDFTFNGKGFVEESS